VLVVDDDPFITRMVRRVLASDHDVVDYTEPREALDAIARGERFDIVLCDVRMPTLSGEAFHAAVRDVSAPLADRIVFMTGTTSLAPGSGFLHDLTNRRLMKPFGIDLLRTTIDELFTAWGRWRA
jgi:DNA-binding NtrC family response regulator